MENQQPVRYQTHSFHHKPHDSLLAEAVSFQEMGLVAYLLHDYETARACWQAATQVFQQLNYPDEVSLLREWLAHMGRRQNAYLDRIQFGR